MQDSVDPQGLPGNGMTYQGCASMPMTRSTIHNMSAWQIMCSKSGQHPGGCAVRAHPLMERPPPRLWELQQHLDLVPAYRLQRWIHHHCWAFLLLQMTQAQLQLQCLRLLCVQMTSPPVFLRWRCSCPALNNGGGSALAFLGGGGNMLLVLPLPIVVLPPAGCWSAVVGTAG